MYRHIPLSGMFADLVIAAEIIGSERERVKELPAETILPRRKFGLSGRSGGVLLAFVYVGFCIQKPAFFISAKRRD
jgi:hypothetical protein